MDDGKSERYARSKRIYSLNKSNRTLAHTYVVLHSTRKKIQFRSMNDDALRV